MQMTFTSPRATFEETLAFANAVREAGGGVVLDALMPAIPQATKACLIARNLNFNCSVVAPTDDTHTWRMSFEDQALRDRIATALELPTEDAYGRHYAAHYLMLPPEIGQVAADFDAAQDTINTLVAMADDPDFAVALALAPTQEEIQVAKEMLPYIEASKEEAARYGTILNGKLVL